MTPLPDDVRRQLDRIVASDGFANADRMSAFLTYVVERTLAGDGGQVKEYAIGVDVFGRDASYDPRLDSIVRVEARRLRTKLDEYYSGAGAGDPIAIRIRRGTYVPDFASRPAMPPGSLTSDASSTVVPHLRPGTADPGTARPIPRVGRVIPAVTIAAAVLIAVALGAAGWRRATHSEAPAVTLAVLPFAEYSGDAADTRLAERLTDGVTRELARDGMLGVVSNTSAKAFGGKGRRASEVGQALKADILVEASIERHADRVDVSVRLVRTATERKMWVEDFSGAVADPADLERRIAAAVGPAALKQP